MAQFTANPTPIGGGIQTGPWHYQSPLIDLFVFQFFATILSSKTNKGCSSFRRDRGAIAVEVSSIKAVASSEGLRHYPPIIKADSATQAGIEGPTGTTNTGRTGTLMPDRGGVGQRWSSAIKKIYKKIKGCKPVSFFRKGKKQG